jgi:hypothetical protein
VILDWWWTLEGKESGRGRGDVQTPVTAGVMFVLARSHVLAGSLIPSSLHADSRTQVTCIIPAINPSKSLGDV